MSIAIIGSGNVRSALGRGWLRAAEDVVFGVPNPADPKYNPLPCERLLTPQEAARNTQTVVLATPWQATETAVKGLGDLLGKIVIDYTNPLGMGPNGLDASHRLGRSVAAAPSGLLSAPSNASPADRRRGQNPCHGGTIAR